MKFLFIMFCGLATIAELQAQTGLAKANNISIAYESFGKTADPPIILIQGTGAPMINWSAVFCQKLASRGYRVIRFDNRDIGLSTRLDALGQPDWGAIFPLVKTCKPAPLPYTLLDMAKDVVGLMDALHIKKAHIAGASMGGAIAQLMAINFPDRLITLTSISATTGNPGRPAGTPEALQAMGTPPPQTQDKDSLAAYLVHVYKALGSTDDDNTLRERAMNHIDYSWYPEGVNRQVAAVLIGDYCDRRADLANIKIPTLVIQGDLDPIVPLEAGREVANTIPGAEFVVIRGMGHDGSLKFTEQIVDAIAKHAGK